MKFIKNNWFKLSIIVFICLFSGVYFYWFQWRPFKIKKECSWTKKHRDAYVGVTQEEAKKQKEECVKELDKQKILYSSGNALDKLLMEVCNRTFFRPPLPAKDWYEKATEKEYKFCLHDRGL